MLSNSTFPTWVTSNRLLEGLQKDLNLGANDFNLVLSLFSVSYRSPISLSSYSYILFQIPGNLGLRNIRPYIFFPAIILGSGIVSHHQMDD